MHYNRIFGYFDCYPFNANPKKILLQYSNITIVLLLLYFHTTHNTELLWCDLYSPFALKLLFKSIRETLILTSCLRAKQGFCFSFSSSLAWSSYLTRSALHVAVGDLERLVFEHRSAQTAPGVGAAIHVAGFRSPLRLWASPCICARIPTPAPSVSLGSTSQFRPHGEDTAQIHCPGGLAGGSIWEKHSDLAADAPDRK